MQIDWLTGVRRATCRLCGDGGAKSAVLAVDHVLPGLPRVELLRCAACGCAFLLDPPPVSYATDTREGAADHYVEQGAGIDVMATPLLRFAPASVRRFLEIGCGYGFALDFGREALGWEVQGVDPSPLAALGGRALALPIVNAYLDRDLDLGARPFDLVLCSEVLEHVERPHELLHTIVGRLADDGVLVLTTPDLAAVQPTTPADTLGRVLSAGLHVVLYDRAALGRLLTESGLAAFHIEESGATLVAFAARSPENLARAGEPPRDGRATIRGYFARRAAAFAEDSALACGFAYRHFKECVNGGRYEEAASSRERLACVLAARFGIDLAVPADTVEALRRALRPNSAGPVPYNLGGALYFAGMLALQHPPARGRQGHLAAAGYFAAAAEATRLLLAYERPSSIYDYETLDLLHQSRKHLPLALAESDPDAAVAACAALTDSAASAPDAADALPPVLVTEAFALTFTRLVNGGAFAAAETLAPHVEKTLEDGDPGRAGDTLRLDALYCLGMLALQRGRAEAAAGHFGLAYERSLPDAAARPHFLWSARLHEGLALARSGAPVDALRAEDILRAIASGTHPSLPPVPTDIASRARSAAGAGR